MLMLGLKGIADYNKNQPASLQGQSGSMLLWSNQLMLLKKDKENRK